MRPVLRNLPRALAIALLVCAAGCTGRDPEVAKREHVSAGDRYLAAGKPREAVIEYRKAAQLDARWAEPARKLGTAYMEAGEPGHAYEAFARAADLDPKDTQSALRAGELLLAAGEFERARARAELLLERQPGLVDGQILLGQALAGLDRPDAAIRQLQEAISLDPESGRAHAALGAVQLSRGAVREAEEAFRAAVEQAPESRDAHLALASYLLATGNRSGAEAAFRRAHALEPEGELTNRALGTFLLAIGRLRDAEPYFVAAGRAHRRSRLALADYYIRAQRPQQAEDVLASLSEDRDLTASVETRRAAIRYADGRKEEAHALLRPLLQGRTPAPLALLLEGRFLLAEGKADEAAKMLERAVKAEPSSAPAQYALGLAHVARGDRDSARTAFENVTRLNPRAAAGHLQLARLALQAGDPRRAAALAREAAAQDPASAAAQLAMVRTLRASGDLGRAEQAVDRLLEAHPQSALLWVERGAVRLERRDAEGARTAFTRAQALAPNAYEPLAGLTMVDLAAGRAKEARSRLSGALSRDGDPRLSLLAARAALAERDVQTAERLLTALVAKHPGLLEAYAQLGRVYVATGRLEEARREFAKLDRSSPVTAHTMQGLILEAQQRPAEARAAYERALAADGSASVAANNLAWLLLDIEGQAQEALRLARIAQRANPDQPEMNDTLGWVLHRTGASRDAVEYLARATQLRPASALYHYHLGMALQAAGEEQKARASLQRALRIDDAFPGHADARRALLATP